MIIVHVINVSPYFLHVINVSPYILYNLLYVPHEKLIKCIACTCHKPKVPL